MRDLPPPELVGLDLDNTVIDYSPAYPAIAADLGLDASLRERGVIREALRRPSDDLAWRVFQAHLYTRGLGFAQPAAGLLAFLERCQDLSIAVAVVSHKTPRSAEDATGRDLHGPAREWLERHLHATGALDRAAVHLCPTRSEKIARIASLRVGLFVDDLVEVLLDPAFPHDTRRLLYVGPAGDGSPGPGGLPQVGFPLLTAWLLAASRREA